MMAALTQMMAALAQSEDVALLGVTEPRRSLDEHFKHRLEIRTRSADRFEHVAGRGLVFERFLQIAGATTQFVKKPGILHRNDRLRGKVLQQRDLLVGERADLLAVCADCAQQHAVPSQRDRQEGADAAQIHTTPIIRNVTIRVALSDIRKVDHPLAAHQMRQWAVPPRPNRVLLPVFNETWVGAGRDLTELLTVENHQIAQRRAAQAACLLQYRIEHWCQIARGGIDDVQYLGGRGLLLQCLACLGQEPRVFHCDDRLRREVLEQSDLFVGEWTDLPTADESMPTILLSLRRGTDRKVRTPTASTAARAIGWLICAKST